MPKIRHIFIAMIFFGLIVAEAVPMLTKLASPAQSERKLTAEEQNTILSILQKPENNTSSAFTGKFLDINWPLDPSSVRKDAINSSNLIGGTQFSSVAPTTPATNPSTNTDANDILIGLIPPISSNLYYAYQDGGRMWYSKGDNLLVIFPNESIKSFSKKTGIETAWMQDRLAYPPINDPTAYTNYQKNYQAMIVAEATQWVLMEFPSGGLVKVSKPQFAIPNTGGGTIYTIPTTN